MNIQPGESYEYFIEQYKELLKGDYTREINISPTYEKRDSIKPLLEEYECKTLLDFGCARAVQWTEFDLQGYWNLSEVRLYDPAIEEYSEYPTGSYDAVICIDVMEHIPEDSIDYVVNQILDKATKLVIFRICIAPASAILPDGQNAHVTVQNSQWWRERIARHKRDGIAIEVNRVIV